MSRISNIGTGGSSGGGGAGVSSIAKQGSTKITGDVTLSAGSNVTLTESGQNIQVAASGGGVFARPATFVVAASNAKDTTNADYICTGTNDDVTIQTAINALPSNGGTVLLTDGTYTIGSTIILTAFQRLIGQGSNATIITTSVDMVLIQMGNRQADSIMRNYMCLQDLSATQTGGTQTHANVKIDGGGQGTSIERVQTNQGFYGFELMDLDRCYFENIVGSNPGKAGIFLEVGLENTYGTVTFVNCIGVLSNNSTYGFYVNANADQSSPNAPDRLNFIGCHMFMTTGLTGCIGFYNVIQITAVNFIGTLFEQCIRQYRSDGNGSVVNFLGCTFLDANSACTDCAYMNDSFGSYTFRDCRFQEATNCFNGVSGFPHISLEGRNTNQGGITNVFAGSFGNKMGTDTVFAGDSALVSGESSHRYANVFGNSIIGNPLVLQPSSDSTTGIKLTKADGSTAVITVDTSNGNALTITQGATDNSTKIATTAFVTTAIANAIAGVNPAVAVQYATTTAGNTSGLTYNNGTSGIGATLTGVNNTATTIDGHTFVVGDVGITRILVKNDTQSPSGAFNGVYLFTALHTSITGDIFTRALDYDTPSDINNTGAIPVISGTANASTSWVQTAQIVTVGTTPLAFTQFSLNPTTVMTTTTYDAAAIAQQVVGTTATQTVTNKRITRRVTATTQSATPAINTDNMDVSNITGLAQAITSMTTNLTGTPVNGDLLEIRITDNGTARAITWGTSFASTTATLPATTVISTMIRTLLEWNSTTSKWECLAVS